MTEDLKGLTPPEVDEAWAEAIQGPGRRIASASETLRSARRYLRAGGHYTAQGERMKAEGDQALYEAQQAYHEASAPFDAEFARRGGWTRYLIVMNSNGHVHRPYCHTLIPGRTLVAPVYALSGQDGEGVVAAAGHTACSKCFPDAPVQTVEDKRAANVAKGRCAGTGQRATKVSNNRRYGRCPECGETYGVSGYGIIRPHKAKKEAQ